MKRPIAVALPSSSARSRLMTNGRRKLPDPERDRRVHLRHAPGADPIDEQVAAEGRARPRAHARFAVGRGRGAEPRDVRNVCGGADAPAAARARRTGAAPGGARARRSPPRARPRSPLSTCVALDRPPPPRARTRSRDRAPTARARARSRPPPRARKARTARPRRSPPGRPAVRAARCRCRRARAPAARRSAAPPSPVGPPPGRASHRRSAWPAPAPRRDPARAAPDGPRPRTPRHCPTSRRWRHGRSPRPRGRSGRPARRRRPRSARTPASRRRRKWRSGDPGTAPTSSRSSSKSANVSLSTRPRSAARNRGFATALAVINATASVCSASASRASSAASRALRPASSPTRRVRVCVIARSATYGRLKIAAASAKPASALLPRLSPAASMNSAPELGLTGLPYLSGTITA